MVALPGLWTAARRPVPRGPGGRVSCRTCWPVRYPVAYLGRQRNRRLLDALRWCVTGCSDLVDQELDPLSAPRRRGVRRGRRVFVRAVRRLARHLRRYDG